MKQLIIVHSCDSTTAFLEGIVNFLKGRGCREFTYLKICEAGDNAEECRILIRDATHGSTIVFLGHGASHCVHLPLAEDQAIGAFINSNNFDILDGKNFICLSCRSAEFIRTNFPCENGSAMLGFADLPTHWADVEIEREMGNFRAYTGITDEELSAFREILVRVFASALYDAIAGNLDFNAFYLRLRLYINRRMFQVASYSISGKPSLLANMLYELKDTIELFGNPSAHIL